MSTTSPADFPVPIAMRAYTHTSRGPPSMLTLSSLPIPSLSSRPNALLIRISHAAINPGGSIMMQLAPSFIRTKPCIPELDFAGTVVKLCDEYPLSGELKVGTKVFGSIPVSDHMKGSGTLAEYVAVDAKYVYPVPKGMKLEEAAGLGVAGCTALDLFDTARVKEGMRVLVNAAGGGIGCLILQMVKKAIGSTGTVVAICSDEKAELVRRLGADEVLDHRTTNFYELLRQGYADRPFDIVIDALGIQTLFESSPTFLKPSGLFVTVGVLYSELSYWGMLGTLVTMAKTLLWPVALGGVPRKYLQVASSITPDGMKRLAALCEEGMEVPVDSVWEVDDVSKVRYNHVYVNVLTLRRRMNEFLARGQRGRL